RLVDVTRDFLLRHARIMLERQRFDRICALTAAADADEAHDRADVGAAARQPLGLFCWIEVLGLQSYRGRDSHCGDPAQPPVIGGKNAISRAPAIAVSGLTCLRSIAARITFGFSNA